MRRCINIDWLEVFTLEKEARLPSYFQQAGYSVRTREYGTPQYRSMFTLLLDGQDFIEIRRDPYSTKDNGGIFDRRATHIRLCNRTCYFSSPIDTLRAFLLRHEYTFLNITRIDLCADFNTFDDGEDPPTFVERYMRGDVSKVYNSRVAAHGKDFWNGKIWNSLKWGAPTSAITTKLYNKSLEMKEQQAKFYIVDCWEKAGLNTSRDVWRIEFAVKSEIKGFVRLDTGELVLNTLSAYDSAAKILRMFFTLATRYFDFRQVTAAGKYRSPHIPLFSYNRDEVALRPVRLTENKAPGRTERMLVKKLQELSHSADTSYLEKQSAKVLLLYFKEHFRLS